MKSKTCQHCGIKFVPKYRVSKAYWKRARYCSTKCAIEHQRGKRRSTFDVAQKTIEERFWSKVDKRGPDECWPWLGAKQRGGYGYLGNTRRRGAKKAHRLSYELHFGSPGELCVCHRCDNPNCVNPTHLFLGTKSDNALDMWTKNRGSRRDGERNPKAKLTWKDVRCIRKLYREGMTQQEIATKHDVCQVNISAILCGKIWKELV